MSRVTPEVIITKSQVPDYFDAPPFHPAESYPERIHHGTAGVGNPAYAAVREALRLSGADADAYGTEAWNPLGAWIRPGDHVLLKPNLVKESHPRDPEGWRYVMTHGSVIRAVADYVAIALRGDGAIWLGDAPQTDSCWNDIVSVLKLDRLVEFYASLGVDFELVDFRKEEWRHEDGVVTDKIERPGDPRGYVAFDIGDRSEFHEHSGSGRYYGADYDAREVNAHHSHGKHEYLISGSAVHADVFINIPKMKTHKKAGVTLNLKNLVGINGDKNWLPHHTSGFPGEGGDEFPQPTFGRRIEQRAIKLLRKAAVHTPKLGTRLYAALKPAGKRAFGDTEEVVRGGNWYGNDTVWRMCLDLNKVLLYGGVDGRMRADAPEGKKRYLSFVDGIIAGEGRGPMNPDPVPVGLLLFGDDPVAVDVVATRLMGYAPESIPIVGRAAAARGWYLGSDRPKVRSTDPALVGEDGAVRPVLGRPFDPHFGWRERLLAG